MSARACPLVVLAALVGCGGAMKVKPPLVSTGREAPRGELFWLAGFAQDAKLGAVVEARDLVARCEGHDGWPAGLAGLPVLVAGRLETRTSPSLPVGPAGERYAGAEGPEHVLLGCAPVAATEEPDLVAAAESIFTAIARRDLEALDRLVASDLVVRLPGRPDLDRRGFLDAVAAIPDEIVAVRREGVTAHRAGDAGVVQGRLAGGGAFLGVFARRSGGWVLVHALGARSTGSLSSRGTARGRGSPPARR
jgi:hypothetical protein